VSERIAFEAIKYALRQSKDGVVVSFVVHPNDVQPALMSLPIGSRVMVGWQEINDDEKPVAENTATIAAKPAENKQKRKFSDLSLPEQCALRCDDPRFERYLGDIWGPAFDENGGHVATTVRALLRVKSRSELSTDHDAANRWRQIESNYQRWLTDETYKESVR
jgi:hypothetical protein